MIKLKTLKTALGNEIVFWGEKKIAPQHVLFLIGGFHGDEVEGPYLLERFIDLCKSRERFSNYDIYVIPCLNPDGMMLHQRENANNIDLNRNYPTSDFQKESFNPHTGKSSSGSPCSEIETQWLMGLIEAYRPKQVLSIHSDLQVVDFDGPAEEWAKQIAILTGYPLVHNVGYSTPGSFGTWAGKEHHIPVVTLEVEKASTNDELNKLWDKMTPLFESFL